LQQTWLNVWVTSRVVYVHMMHGEGGACLLVRVRSLPYLRIWCMYYEPSPSYVSWSMSQDLCMSRIMIIFVLCFTPGKNHRWGGLVSKCEIGLNYRFILGPLKCFVFKISRLRLFNLNSYPCHTILCTIKASSSVLNMWLCRNNSHIQV
jgi:hypothetical protein